MTVFTLVFLVVFVIELVLLVRGIVQLLKKSQRGKVTLLWAGWLAVCYLIVLVGVGVSSRAKKLAIGQRKCFDDWCFVVTGSEWVAGGLDIHAAAVNTGRRAHAPDSPKLYSIVDGKLSTLECSAIRDRIEGHSERPLTLHVAAPSRAKVEILVTEGGGPSMVIIEDENSPFHAKSTWDVTPSPLSNQEENK